MGFLASTASDTISNVFRVLKTVKQTAGVGGGSGSGTVLSKPNVIQMRQLQFTQGQSHLQVPLPVPMETGTNTNSYTHVIQQIVRESGFSGLFTRGLGTRILSNGVQSVLFTIVWKELAAYLASNTTTNNNTNTTTGDNTTTL